MTQIFRKASPRKGAVDKPMNISFLPLLPKTLLNIIVFLQYFNEILLPKCNVELHLRYFKGKLQYF